MNSNYAKLTLLITDPDVLYELEERVGLRMDSGMSKDEAENITYLEYVERNK